MLNMTEKQVSQENKVTFNEMSENIIEVRNLTVGYHGENGFVTVVKDLSLKIRRNIIFGIAGESGSGKSTLAAAIFRNLKYPGEVLEGSVLFDGVDMGTLKRGELRRTRALRFSYIPQAAMNSLNPVKRIGAQFEDILLAHDLNPDSNTDMIRKSLEMVRLDENVLSMFPHELSGGMRQRVVISMALLLNPEAVILDEPTTGLDVLVEHEMLRDLKTIQQSMNLTMVFITHDLSILFQMADEIAIMYGGELMEQGPYNSLLKSPANPYTYLLLESMPRIGVKRADYVRMKSGQIDFSTETKGCKFSSRCPYSRDDCKIQNPEWLSTDSGNHFYRCMHYPEWKNTGPS